MFFIIYNLIFMIVLFLPTQRCSLWVQTFLEDFSIFRFFRQKYKEKTFSHPGEHHQRAVTLIKLYFRLFVCFFELKILRFLFLFCFTYPKQRNLYLKSFTVMGVKSLIYAFTIELADKILRN